MYLPDFPYAAISTFKNGLKRTKILSIIAILLLTAQRRSDGQERIQIPGIPQSAYCKDIKVVCKVDGLPQQLLSSSGTSVILETAVENASNHPITTIDLLDGRPVHFYSVDDNGKAEPFFAPLSYKTTIGSSSFTNLNPGGSTVLKSEIPVATLLRAKQQKIVACVKCFIPTGECLAVSAPFQFPPFDQKLYR